MAKTTKKPVKKNAAKAADSTTAPVGKKTVAKKAVAKKQAAAKKSASKKATTKKVVAKKKRADATAARKAAAKRPSPAPSRRISANERHRMIAEAAYLRGETQGFLSDEHEDWLLAEAEVDARLAKAGVTLKG